MESGTGTGPGAASLSPAVRDQGLLPDDRRILARQRARTRGATACSHCRARKTKCDNRRPACGYCLRVRAQCSYEADVEADTCHLVGSELLEKIDTLTGLLQQSQALRLNSLDGVALPPIFSSAEPSPQPAQSHVENHYHNHHYYSQESNQSTQTNEDSPGPHSSHTTDHRPDRSPQSVGVDSVLSWKIFQQITPFLTLPAESDCGNVQSTHLPNVEYAELARLEAKYIAYVHTKNPIVDPYELHNRIRHVAEEGLSWSTSTCLVALVCALGATSERYAADQHTSPGFSPDGILVDHQLTTDLDIADRFWNVAAKRIGFAMAENSLEAVQCLCLAGIWYMYNLQPLQSWKYFSLASNAWYASVMTRLPPSTALRDAHDEGRSLTLEQSLYFTCYKSECEFAFELPLPPSILHNIGYPHAFPSPPNLDNEIPDDAESIIQRRSWYYYLAEIASRHLLNRVLQAQPSTQPRTPKAIRCMLGKVHIFRSQLEDWYNSLPPSLSFPPPLRDIVPLDDELSQLLRGRYLSILELCYRPFVQLCVSGPLDIEPDLLAQVADAASRNLEYCVIRLQGTRTPNRHHGLWFILRLVTTMSLVLVAADRARRDQALNGARMLRMPEGWREQMMYTRELFARYWGDRRGGIYQCSQILDWAFAEGEEMSLQ